MRDFTFTNILITQTEKRWWWAPGKTLQKSSPFLTYIEIKCIIFRCNLVNILRQYICHVVWYVNNTPWSSKFCSFISPHSNLDFVLCMMMNCCFGHLIDATSWRVARLIRLDFVHVCNVSISSRTRTLPLPPFPTSPFSILCTCQTMSGEIELYRSYSILVDPCPKKVDPDPLPDPNRLENTSTN